MTRNCRVAGGVLTGVTVPAVTTLPPAAGGPVLHVPDAYRPYALPPHDRALIGAAAPYTECQGLTDGRHAPSCPGSWGADDDLPDTLDVPTA